MKRLNEKDLLLRASKLIKNMLDLVVLRNTINHL